jgi:IS605 OrfB family transposase
MRLREWRGVKPVAGPPGAAITTRLRTTQAEDAVLDAVAGHLGRLRRADLAQVCRPATLTVGAGEAGRQARRDGLNARKRSLTALSSARWAHSVIVANDAQHRAARSAQDRHTAGLGAAISAIGKRLSEPTADRLTRQERAARRKDRLPMGYATQAERFQKQRRLQSLRAELARVTAERDSGRLCVAEGGKRLARTRHNLQAAGLTLAGWRQAWEAARWRIEAIGTGAERFGNLTITVTPGGEVSIRLPRPLEHLANARHGRYVLSGPARFAYRGDEWLARITGGKPISYTITRRPGRAGVYLTAAWAAKPETPITGPETSDSEVRAAGPIAGVDLNDGHLAVRRLDPHGNPAGRPERIEFRLAGSAARRDAQVRHAVTRLIRYTKRHHIDAIAVEDLDFADARTVGREIMGRGQRGRRFRRTVSGIPTAVFRRRLTAQTSRHGIRLYSVNPAYTSSWGDQHWRRPYENVTRHEAAATVIGRRAQGHQARRREGVTRARPEDGAVRATDQAGPNEHRVNTSSRRRPGMRGTESRPPGRARTRLPDRATATPAQALMAKHTSSGTTCGKTSSSPTGRSSSPASSPTRPTSSSIPS